MDEKHTKKQFVFSDAVLFDVILLGGLLVLFVVSFNYNPLARSIPMALSAIGFVMIFLQFLVDGFPGLRPKLPFVSEGGLLSGKTQAKKSGDQTLKEEENASQSTAERNEESEEGVKAWWRVSRLALWLAGFIFLLGKIHYLIAVGGFVTLVTRIEARESWKRSVLLAIGVNAGFYVLFDLILKAQI